MCIATYHQSVVYKKNNRTHWNNIRTRKPEKNPIQIILSNGIVLNKNPHGLFETKDKKTYVVSFLPTLKP